MNAVNGSEKLEPNSPAVHKQRQEQKALKQANQNINGGNNALISGGANENDDNDSDDDNDDGAEFVQLLKDYKLSQCKPILAENGIKTKNDLKDLNFEQLNNIELKLKRFKQKQFRKLVQGEVNPNYKKDQDSIKNSNYIYSSSGQYNNGFSMSNSMNSGTTSVDAIRSGSVTNQSHWNTNYNNSSINSNGMGSISNNNMNYGSQYPWSPQSFVNTADGTLWNGYGGSKATSLTSRSSVLSQSPYT